MPTSVYVHIPYCSAKCHYCSFVSFCDKSSVKKYLSKLQQEIDYFYSSENLKTLYLGGGTPSILTPKQIKNIVVKFQYDKICEKTMELNPENIDENYLSRIFDAGINRISIGCQSFDDAILKQINRRHNSQKVIKSVKLAQKTGFKNISLDFIYGLPNQTIKNFEQDLKKAIDLGIQHISLYGLKIEEGCYFSKHPPTNLPDDDLQADMYLMAVETLKNNGFEHYEVSNFSLPGFNSQHNLTYWKNQEYYGFGVSASGYKNGIRYDNVRFINNYLQNPIKHLNEKILTQKEKLEEEIFLGLRIIEGIDPEKISQKYGINFEEKYSEILKKYIKLNLLNKKNNKYSFTPDGILVSNVILSDFIE